MAQGADDRGPEVEESPEEVRARMAQTRAALGRKLQTLKHRLLGTKGTSSKKGANQTMPAKKTSKKSASSRSSGKTAGKKKTGAKTTSAKRSTASRGRGSKAAKKSTRKPTRKRSTATKAKKVAKKVATEMLAGAAVGAVKGAVEAIAPPPGQTQGQVVQTGGGSAEQR